MAGKKIKGITVEIGGDTVGLEKSLKDVNSAAQPLQKELSQVNRLLKFNPESTELIAQKQKLLGDQISNTTDRLNILKQAQKEVDAAFEKGDLGEEAYRKFQREVVQAEGKLKHLKEQQERVGKDKSGKKAARDISKITDAAEKATKALKTMGKAGGAAAKGIGAGAAAGAAGLTALVAGTQELNMDLAKLDYNAFNEGFNPDKVREGFKEIAALSGDTGAAVETVSNLMATGFDENQLAEAINLVNGAAIKFSDTLKTEGIADGIQETFATGEAVGPFAELLERSGVNLDTFNEGLASAAKNGTEADYVLQQMSDIGLASVNEGFKEMNSEVYAQQEAQLGLQLALAALSEALLPLATLATEFLTKLAEWATENINLVKSFDSISEGITALLPELFGKGIQMISTIVQAIIDNLPMILESGFKILRAVIEGILQMLPELIAAAQKLLPVVKQILIENLPMILNAGIDILLALVDGIIEMLPELIAMALELIVVIATELINNLPKIINAGIDLIFALIDGLIDALPDLINAVIFDIIPAFLNAFNDANMIEIGENIIQGLIDGMWNLAQNLWNAAKDIASGIGEKVASILKLGSPSRVMVDYGEDTGEGLQIGLKRSIHAIQQTAASMGQSVIDSIGAFLGGGDAVRKYFEAIQEDGDWLNDWLTHMPDKVKDLAMQLGYVLAPSLEGTRIREDMPKEWQEAQRAQNMTVNIHSPKALNVREAKLVWNRQMKQMALQW